MATASNPDPILLSKLSCLKSLSQDPQVIMDKDLQLLEQLKQEQIALLHLYAWKKSCLTYGHFLKPKDILLPLGLKKFPIPMGKRPTGGGICFHGGDWTFSLLIPRHSPLFRDNVLESYACINQVVIDALKEWLPCSLLTSSAKAGPFCMAQPTPYDLIYKGKKIGGAAQRKKSWGLLHQASFSLSPPPKDLLSALLSPPLHYALVNKSISFLTEEASEESIEDFLEQFNKSLLRTLKRALA